MSLNWKDGEMEKWKRTERGGTRVVRRTKFIPCKVLLSEIHAEMPSSFSPDMLLQRLIGQKIRIGLAVDTTFDSKSYFHNPNIWKEWDIKMFKMSDKYGGASMPPPLESLWTFIKETKVYLRSDPKAHILVYSRLGYNVVGYFIVGYMCEVLGMKLNDSLRLFKECREPGIYCKATLQALQFINEKRWSRRRSDSNVSNVEYKLPPPPKCDSDSKSHETDLSKDWLKTADLIVRDMPPPSTITTTSSRKQKPTGTAATQQRKKSRPNVAASDNNHLVAPDGSKTLKLWVKEVDSTGVLVYRKTVPKEGGEKVNVKLPSPWVSKGWHLQRNTKGTKLYWWNQKTNKSAWREGEFASKPPGV